MGRHYLEYNKKVQAKKELIEKSLLSDGEYPNKNYVKSLLDNINGHRLAILDYIDVESLSNVDIERINGYLYNIKQDFNILFDIVNELTIDKYNKLESLVNGHLLSLEELVSTLDRRASYETETTSLNADIVYFSDSISDVSLIDKTAKIRLGSMSFEALSKIVCYIKGTGFSQRDVSFTFEDYTGQSKRVLPFGVNRDYIKNPGDWTKREYTHKLDKSLIQSGLFLISDFTIPVNKDYKYKIFGGINKLKANTITGTKYITSTDTHINISGYTESFNFNVVGASKITFDFSGIPENMNFSDYVLNNLSSKYINNFKFDLPSGISFRFETDGTVYAEQEQFAIQNNNLYLANITEVEDLLIIVYQPGDSIIYPNVEVTIHDIETTSIHIDSIAIGQISDFEVLEE